MSWERKTFQGLIFLPASMSATSSTTFLAYEEWSKDFYLPGGVGKEQSSCRLRIGIENQEERPVWLW